MAQAKTKAQGPNIVASYHFGIIKRNSVQTYFIKKPIRVPLPDTKPVGIWK